MKKLEEIQFNVEQVKKKGFDYFKANILDLIKREAIGYKENGKVIVPKDGEIKTFFEKLTGFTVNTKDNV